MRASTPLADEIWMMLPEPPPMPEAVENGLVPVNGLDVYDAVHGQDQSIILSHGGFGIADYWSN